jgi:hypothetical protein
MNEARDFDELLDLARAGDGPARQTLADDPLFEVLEATQAEFEGRGMARVGDASRLEEFARRALAEHAVSDVPGPPRAGRPLPRGGGSKAWMWALISGATVVAVIVLLAWPSGGVGGAEDSVPSPTTTRAEASDGAVQVETTDSRSAKHEVPGRGSSALPSPLSEVQPAESVEAESGEARSEKGTREPTARGGARARRDGIEVAPPTARELLVAARASRGAEDWSGAADRYAELERHHRGTPEEITARVAWARMELDQRNAPARALRLFEAYLAARPDGSVAEEARVGKAVALGKLGRAGAERQAWAELLDRHPTTLSATRARRRMGELAKGD